MRSHRVAPNLQGTPIRTDDVRGIRETLLTSLGGPLVSVDYLAAEQRALASAATVDIPAHWAYTDRDGAEGRRTAEEYQMSERRIWASDGATRHGYVHRPQYDGPVATVDTFGAGPGYYSVRISDDRRAVVLTGTANTPASGGPNPPAKITSLIGQTFRSRDALYDALYALGYLVLTTHSGGTYWLARGEMPSDC